jgi:hypothetical protein
VCLIIGSYICSSRQNKTEIFQYQWQWWPWHAYFNNIKKANWCFVVKFVMLVCYNVTFQVIFFSCFVYYNPKVESAFYRCSINKKVKPKHQRLICIHLTVTVYCTVIRRCTKHDNASFTVLILVSSFNEGPEVKQRSGISEIVINGCIAIILGDNINIVVDMTVGFCWVEGNIWNVWWIIFFSARGKFHLVI